MSGLGQAPHLKVGRENADRRGNAQGTWCVPGPCSLRLACLEDLWPLSQGDSPPPWATRAWPMCQSAGSRGHCDLGREAAAGTDRLDTWEGTRGLLRRRRALEPWRPRLGRAQAAGDPGRVGRRPDSMRVTCGRAGRACERVRRRQPPRPVLALNTIR